MFHAMEKVSRRIRPQDARTAESLWRLAAGRMRHLYNFYVAWWDRRMPSYDFAAYGVTFDDYLDQVGHRGVPAVYPEIARIAYELDIQVFIFNYEGEPSRCSTSSTGWARRGWCAFCSQDITTRPRRWAATEVGPRRWAGRRRDAADGHIQRCPSPRRYHGGRVAGGLQGAASRGVVIRMAWTAWMAIPTSPRSRGPVKLPAGGWAAAPQRRDLQVEAG